MRGWIEFIKNYGRLKLGDMSLKILVTGGRGFIGQRLIDLLSKENELYCIVRSPVIGFRENINWIVRDLLKDIDDALLPSELDSIIHLAQSRDFRNFPDKAEEIYRININSTFQLLEYGRKIGIKSFIFASSGGVCGYKNGPVFENNPPHPLNFYLNSKYISESIISSYKDFFATIILRFFFVYGEGQRDMLIPTLIDRVKNGQEIIIYGKGGTKINPIYVDDAVMAIVKALNLNGCEVINVAGSEIISIKELSGRLGKKIGKDPKYNFIPAPGDIDLVGDIERMRIKLDLEPKITLEEGLDRVLGI